MCNNKIVNFWYDDWLNNTSLIDYVVAPQIRKHVQTQVSNYWDERRGRKWDKFQHLLPNKTLVQMVTINLFPQAPIEDNLTQGASSNSLFSTTSTYSLTLKSIIGVPNRKWQAVWKLKVPKQVGVFTWKVLHGKIASNSLCARRGIIEDASCKACGVAEKTLIHVFKDCYLAKKVWDQLLPLSFKDPFFLIVGKGLGRN